MKAWWAKRSDQFKAAVNSAWQSFVGVFGLTLLGWFADISEWAGDSAKDFPSVSPLGKAAVSAVAAAATAIVTYIYRKAKPVSTTYKGVDGP